MIQKGTVLLIVSFFIKTTVLSQGIDIVNAASNGKDSLSPDIIETKVKEIAFITNDTILRGLMTFDTLGIFYAFGSQQRLDEYIASQTGMNFYYKDDSILGTGNYLRVCRWVEDMDTIYNYRNNIEYYDGKGPRADNLRIPILEYDIEHSYILQQMKQNICGQYIYCLINDGTKRFYGIHPKNYQRTSVLLKVDTTQDTTYNFFMYKVQSKSYRGMQLVVQDSVIIPLKKLRRKKWLFRNMDELTSKCNSEVFSNNYERTYVLILKGKRYVVSANTELNNEVPKWVALVESISITIEQLQKELRH